MHSKYRGKQRGEREGGRNGGKVGGKCKLCKEGGTDEQRKY